MIKAVNKSPPIAFKIRTQRRRLAALSITKSAAAATVNSTRSSITAQTTLSALQSAPPGLSPGADHRVPSKSAKPQSRSFLVASGDEILWRHGLQSLSIGPGYCAISVSAVSKVMPSTVACATRIRSNGSLWMGGRLSMNTVCSLVMGNSR